MKLAIGTDDQKTICNGYFDDSRYCLVLEVLNAAVVKSGLVPYCSSAGHLEKKTAGHPCRGARRVM